MIMNMVRGVQNVQFHWRITAGLSDSITVGTRGGAIINYVLSLTAAGCQYKMRGHLSLIYVKAPVLQGMVCVVEFSILLIATVHIRVLGEH